MAELVIATDVDGTITTRERRISLRVIKLLRKLRRYGVKIIFVSSHAFPAVSTLGHYIGVDYVIAETGSVGGKPWRPIFVEKLENKQEILEIVKKLGFRLTESAPFRYADISLYPPPDTDPLVALNKLKEALMDFDVDIEYSGYAIHISKKGVNKGIALRRLLSIEKINAPVISFGDGLNDVSLFKYSDLSITSCYCPKKLVEAATIALPTTNLHAVIMALRSIEMFFKLKYKNLDILKKIQEMLEVVSGC